MKCPVCSRIHRSLVSATACAVAANTHIEMLKAISLPVTREDVLRSVKTEYMLKSMVAVSC